MDGYGIFFITSTAPSKQMDIVFNIWGFEVTRMEVFWNLDYAHVCYIYISLSLSVYLYIIKHYVISYYVYVWYLSVYPFSF